jgi:hypothetical protein
MSGSGTVKKDLTRFSHEEISLLLFALEGGQSASPPDPASCEEACPVVETVEELLCGGKIDPKQQLARHLNNHLREAMIDSGVLELMAEQPDSQLAVSPEGSARLGAAQARIRQWSSPINFSAEEQRMLSEALARIPFGAWLSMPRTLWSLRKKLRTNKPIMET